MNHIHRLWLAYASLLLCLALGLTECSPKAGSPHLASDRAGPQPALAAEVVAIPPGLPAKGDRDRDQVDDRIEFLLIQAYAPTIWCNASSAPPCSVEFAVQHCFLRGPGGALLPRNTWRENAANFIPAYIAKATELNDRRNWFLQFEKESFRRGSSDIAGHESSWTRAMQSGNEGVYAHVVRADRDGEFLVSYFILCTLNETNWPLGIGTHEFDWLVVHVLVRLPEAGKPWVDLSGRKPSDFTDQEWKQIENKVLLDSDGVDKTWRILGDQAGKRRRVIAVRLGNHGRFVDLRGDNVEWEQSERGMFPTFYAERLTHELWPCAGRKGYVGWPLKKNGNRIDCANSSTPASGPESPWMRAQKQFFKDGKDGSALLGGGRLPYFNPNGFRISYDFGPGDGLIGMNEENVVCDHLRGGNAVRYVTSNVPNVGELDFPSGTSAEILLSYRGTWGGWWLQNESPRGPVDQGMMWVDPDRSKVQGREALQILPALRSGE